MYVKQMAIQGVIYACMLLLLFFSILFDILKYTC